MTVQDGRDAYRDSRTAPGRRPLDAAALRRSRITRGAAMYRASRRDREAREVLSAAREDPETPPPSAA